MKTRGMTPKALIAEHRRCEVQPTRLLELACKLAHVGRVGCPLCAALRREDRRAGRPTIGVRRP